MKEMIKRLLRMFVLTMIFSYFVLFGIENGFVLALIGFIISAIAVTGVLYLVWRVGNHG